MLSSRTKIDFVIVVVYPSVSNATESTGPELVRASNGKSRVSTSRVLAALVGSRACDVSIIDHIYVASQTNESTVRRILLRKRSTKMDMLRNGSITLVARAASFLSLLPTSRSIFKIIWLVTGAEEYSILISFAQCLAKLTFCFVRHFLRLLLTYIYTVEFNFCSRRQEGEEKTVRCSAPFLNILLSVPAVFLSSLSSSPLHPDASYQQEGRDTQWLYQQLRIRLFW